MLNQDFFFIIQWWFTIFIIGVVFLPLTINLFSNFFDRGYIFSKIIGTALISYTVFILSLFHIAPFNLITIISVAVIFLILNFVFFKNNLIKTIIKNWYFFLFEELIFLIALLFWSFVRSHQPDIHGLEKYMDFGFVNSILRSEYFPPKDMWFTPFSINYYYFGHLVTALLTKLSGIASNITYNLMLSSIFAFTFTASFSIGANLIWQMLKLQITNHKSQINSNNQYIKNSKVLNLGNWNLFRAWNLIFKTLFGGLLTAFLVSFAGNLQIIYTFFKPYANENPLPFWNLIFSPQSFPNSYWYPNATRFIHNTIHEFPIYSFVVSDLHGHVLDIPFVLLTIAILMSLIFNFQFSIFNQTKNFKILNFKLKILLISFLLAVMYMTNVWDGVIYFLLIALVLFYPVLNLFNHSPEKKFPLSKWGFYIASIGILFLIFLLPFSFNFKPFTSGIGILCSPEFLINKGKVGPFLFEQNTCQRSPIWQLIVLYGFFYFWVISFLLMIIKRKNHKLQFSNHKQIQNANVQNSKHLGNWNLFGAWDLRFGILNPSDSFVLILIILSSILIIIPEFIYVKDIYPAHYRANTMFKLVYQSFIMLSISSGYIIVRIISGLKFKILNFKHYWKLPVFTIGGILIVIVLLYPQFAIGSYYNNFKINLGLDGTRYLKNLYPTDYEAIVWINKNIKDQPVILEAQGDSYTDFARVSANTGLPTVLGWTVHEWLWRGTYDIPAPRITEVKTLYENPDINTTKQLINKYKISYVFIGDLEYQQYPSLNEQKFQKLGEAVYQNGRAKIYKIN